MANIFKRHAKRQRDIDLIDMEMTTMRTHGWFAFVEKRPPEGARVLVWSPDLREDVIACCYAAGKLIPLNDTLLKMWADGALVFLSVYWREMVVLPVVGAAERPMKPEFIFKPGDMVIYDCPRDHHVDALKRHLHEPAEVLSCSHADAERLPLYRVKFSKTADQYYGEHVLSEECVSPAPEQPRKLRWGF